MFCCYPWEACPFLDRNRAGVNDRCRRDVGEEERRENCSWEVKQQIIFKNTQNDDSKVSVILLETEIQCEGQILAPNHPENINNNRKETINHIRKDKLSSVHISLILLIIYKKHMKSILKYIKHRNIPHFVYSS